LRKSAQAIAPAGRDDPAASATISDHPPGAARLNFTVRHYARDDEDAAIELWRRTWQVAYPGCDFKARVDWWRERWRRELVPVSAITIAEADGRMVGFVTIEESGYLDQIVVSPEAWGSTVAAALLEEAKMIAPHGIDLHVNKDNLRAIRFYEKHGFFVGGEDVNPQSQSPIFMMCWRPNSPADAAYW
jgi:putative acetyltransferase